MSHTPGPWKFSETSWPEDSWLISDISKREVYVAQIIKHWFNSEANANLIAAAPDLLKALEEVLKTIQNLENEGGHWWIDSPSKGGFDTDEIEAIIAKAKGENHVPRP